MVFSMMNTEICVWRKQEVMDSAGKKTVEPTTLLHTNVIVPLRRRKSLREQYSQKDKANEVIRDLRIFYCRC